MRKIFLISFKLESMFGPELAGYVFSSLVLWSMLFSLSS